MFVSVKRTPLVKGIVLLSAYAAVACSGDVASKDKPGPVHNDRAFSGKPWELAEQCEPDSAMDPGPAPMQRVSNFEFDNMVRDLQANLALPVTLANASADVAPTPGPVTNQHVPGYLSAAKDFADTVVIPNFATFAGCATEDAACGKQFVETFGKRAFRRPLSEAEVTRFTALIDLGTTKKTFATGVGMATQAILNSADFLYKPEIGEDQGGGISKLTGFEMASRLAFYLWRSLPDDALLDSAESGGLDEVAGVNDAVTRLLGDRAKAGPAVAEFFDDWLALRAIGSDGKDATTYPAWNPEIAAAAQTEARLFANGNFWDGLKVSDLFLANTSVMNKPLADFYGITGPAGADFEPTTLDGVHRFGFLTQAGFLSTQAKNADTSPVKRGKFIQLNILCGTVAPPPAGIEAAFPEVDPNGTARERLAQHREEEVCAGCHKYMDPIGLPFEHYDGIGQWRETDAQGRTLDVSGEVVGSKDQDGAYDGVRELADKLSKSYDTRTCYAEKWFERSFARGVVETDSCSLKAYFDSLQAEDFKLMGAATELAKLDAFRYLRSVQ
jgi:hypothetical protein